MEDNSDKILPQTQESSSTENGEPTEPSAVSAGILPPSTLSKSPIFSLVITEPEPLGQTATPVAKSQNPNGQAPNNENLTGDQMKSFMEQINNTIWNLGSKVSQLDEGINDSFSTIHAHFAETAYKH